MPDRSYKVVRRIWRILYPVGIYIAISTVALLLSSGNVGAYLLENGVLGCLIVVPLWLVTRNRWLPAYRMAKPIRVAVLTVGLFYTLQIVCSLLLSLVDVSAVSQKYTQMSASMILLPLWVQIVAIGLLAPVLEECLLRGVMLNRALGWMRPWVAVLLTAVIFALLHGNLLQGSYAFVLGLLLAALYVRFRMLWVPILGHIVFNMTSLYLVEVTKLQVSRFSGLVARLIQGRASLDSILPYLLLGLMSAGLFGWALLFDSPAAAATVEKLPATETTDDLFAAEALPEEAEEAVEKPSEPNEEQA